jgi:serine O-acetyltransferase
VNDLEHRAQDRPACVRIADADEHIDAAIDLASVVDCLCSASHGMARAGFNGLERQVLPSRSELASIVEELRAVLFPGYFGDSDLTAENVKFHVGSTLDHVLRRLRVQVQRGYCFTCDHGKPDCADCDEKAHATTRHFLARLPEIRRKLSTDVQAAYRGDPAATQPEVAIFCYPGLLAVTNYRLAHELHLLQVPLLPRIITELAHSQTGIDIHPGATIGESFFIDHGTGVVIGETAEIGDGVRIYQGVTLGAKSFPLDENNQPIKGIPRHPIVEDDVIIYSGATILGRVLIGRGSVIGGNVWLTHDVPAGSRVTQAQSTESSFEYGGGI